MGSGTRDMTTPLHQMKADFFKTLSHPTRIRILELLSERERSVGDLLSAIGIEASNLSQHLAVIRRAGVVSARREGSVVYYSLVSDQIADLMSVARSILTSVLSDQAELLTTLRSTEEPEPRGPMDRTER